MNQDLNNGHSSNLADELFGTSKSVRSHIGDGDLLCIEKRSKEFAEDEQTDSRALDHQSLDQTDVNTDELSQVAQTNFFSNTEMSSGAGSGIKTDSDHNLDNVEKCCPDLTDSACLVVCDAGSEPVSENNISWKKWTLKSQADTVLEKNDDIILKTVETEEAISKIKTENICTLDNSDTAAEREIKAADDQKKPSQLESELVISSHYSQASSKLNRSMKIYNEFEGQETDQTISQGQETDQNRGNELKNDQNNGQGQEKDQKQSHREENDQNEGTGQENDQNKDKGHENDQNKAKGQENDQIKGHGQKNAQNKSLGHENSKSLKDIISFSEKMASYKTKAERLRRTSVRTVAASHEKSKSAISALEQMPNTAVSQIGHAPAGLGKYSEMMKRINELVKPLHDVLFPGQATPQSYKHSGTQTSSTSTGPMIHSSCQTSSNRSPNKCRQSEKCFIHSTPKLIMCFDCKAKCCSQCILVDGTCHGHRLAEAPKIALPREKDNLMKALETASHDLSLSEISVRDIETELENLEVRCMLRREEIQQEFTSFMDFLIRQKSLVLESLEKEAQHRKQHLEGLLEKHKAMQRLEGRLTDEVTSLVQDSKELDLLPYLRLRSECEKFSASVKSSFITEDSPVTSLLDSPFSLYKEKTQLESALGRDSISHGDIKCIRNTLQMNPANELNLEDVIKLPQFPTSSSQTYKVELVKFQRTKLWETTTTSLKGLKLNCDTTCRLERNETYILRVKVCISIEISALTKVEKEGKSTHMMIIMTDSPMDVSDSDPEIKNFSAHMRSSPEEKRYFWYFWKIPSYLFTSHHGNIGSSASAPAQSAPVQSAPAQHQLSQHQLSRQRVIRKKDKRLQ